MRTRRLLPLAPLIVAGVLSLAACGDDDDASEPDGSSPSAAGVLVRGLDGLKWDAKSYSATAGDVAITLENDSSLPHTLAVIAADDTQVGSVLKANSAEEDDGTYPLTAGTYTIICTVPGHGAMKADLVVS